ncbi:MAG: ATP-binding cassette domain-containing protein [Myxococcales bacterium]|nr:ATP-binding cassette domain-containing protein [Myxococcales bacterium]
MIEVRGLVKRFSGPPVVTAVDQVSFQAKPGEVFGLLGPNGAGKTTTLRMLATLLTPDAGEIEVAGHRASTSPEGIRSRVGFLSTSTGLYGRLTARELLMYFGRLHGVASVRTRVDDLIDRFDLGEVASTRCDRLSTGQRQKVNIARAVVHDPPALILDEPTNGLDVLVAQTFLAFVEEAKAQGRCVVYSTHIMSEAQRLCDRVGVLHKGRLYACGTLAQLRARTGEHYLEQVFIRLVSE